MTERTVPCPDCGRRFPDTNGMQQHAKQKHPHRRAELRRERRAQRARDDEPSLAEIAVEAEMKRSMGLPLDPLEESLLP